MRVVVPFAVADPKTRLADCLSPDERTAFARVLLADVVDAVGETGRRPTVLATEPLTLDLDCEAVIDDRPLSTAVNAVLADASDSEPVAIVMADLALATPSALERLFETTGDVVIAPGLGGGTNALVVRNGDFRVDYHGVSFRDHVENAHAVDADVTTVDSFRLATDVDERSDLAEVLLHGTGRAPEWLTDHGFELSVDGGRVDVLRVE